MTCWIISGHNQIGQPAQQRISNGRLVFRNSLRSCKTGELPPVVSSSFDAITVVYEIDNRVCHDGLESIQGG